MKKKSIKFKIVLSAISVNNLKTLEYHTFVVNVAVMMKKYINKKNKMRR